MDVEHEVAGAAIIALSLFACVWHSRIIAPPQVLSVIGWVVNVLTILALAAIWVRC